MYNEPRCKDMFDNLLRFTCLFLSGDLILSMQSPDYIFEKFDLYFEEINVKENNHCQLYKNNVEVWGENSNKLNSILCFLSDIIKKSSSTKLETIKSLRNIKCRPEDYIESFNEYVGNFKDIKSLKVDNLHKIINRDMVNEYYEIYPQFFNKIKLNEKIKKLKSC